MIHARYNGGIIRPRGSRWIAELTENYITVRKAHTTIEGCQEWIDEQQLKRARQVYELNPRQHIDACDALHLLPAGITLTEAVKFWLERHQDNPLAKMKVGELYRKYLADKTSAGLRPRSLAGIRTFVGRLALAYNTKAISTLNPSILSEYMTAHPCSPVSRNSLRRYWWGFFDYCRRQGAISNNPAESIAPGHANETAPQIFTVEEAGRILNATAKLKPSLLPFVSLGLFCGLRTTELLSLKYSDITDYYIRVDPAIAKKRRQRYVPVPDNLKSRISAWKTRGEESICPMKERRVYHHLRLIAAEAKLKAWKKNACRSSFVSYHIALHQNTALTADIIGHRQNADVLWNHYRELVTKADAIRYFALEIPPAD